MISCQVCWRTMRWHNGQIRRSRNPYPSKVFQDCSSKWEESVAHSILARSLFTPTKAVYMSADQLCPSHFSLAIRRRTIHSGWPATRRLSFNPASLSFAGALRLAFRKERVSQLGVSNLMGVQVRERNAHRENGALVRPALNCDRSLVLLHDPAGNR